MTLHHGDCLDVMAAFEPSSVDAIVTDPPYGIGFMGHEWDQPGEHGPLRAGAGHSPGHPRERERRAAGDDSFTSMEAGRYDRSTAANRRFQSWCEAWARELWRVAKPGAHLLIFGGTRTFHRLVSGLEDAGWEIRDTLVWAYATGFPKSHNLDGEWVGWGTALKPAWEPILLARKPIVGTVAANAAAHGTGALNIDGARIPYQGVSDRLTAFPGGRSTNKPSAAIAAEPDAGRDLGRIDSGATQPELGRWPANVLLTDPIFDGDIDGVVGGGEQSGGGNPARRISDDGRGTYGAFAQGQETGKVPVDTAGTYSRFFLIPKADRVDREPAVRGQIAKAKPPGWSSGEQSPGTFQSQATPPRENVHPTVKPIELMRHLVRLVTPPGGVVLDPFLGSGTTALAAEMEGFRWIGIEREAEYVAIAEARLNGVQKGFGLVV